MRTSKNHLSMVFRMRALVEDRFDDVGAAITKSGEGIDLDLMDQTAEAPI